MDEAKKNAAGVYDYLILSGFMENHR